MSGESGQMAMGLFAAKPGNGRARPVVLKALHSLNSFAIVGAKRRRRSVRQR